MTITTVRPRMARLEGRRRKLLSACVPRRCVELRSERLAFILPGQGRPGQQERQHRLSSCPGDGIGFLRKRFQLFKTFQPFKATFQVQGSKFNVQSWNPSEY